jgi:chromosome segregation ATPase
MIEPEKHTDESLKQYTVEIQEVISRMEDQKFVLTNGIVVTTKSLLTDFVNIINYYSRETRKNKSKILDLERSEKRLQEHNKQLEDRSNEVRVELDVKKSRLASVEDELVNVVRQNEDLRSELEAIKRTKMNQRRTIQK